MANFVFVYVAETYASVRSKLIGYLQAGGSTFSNWIAGGIGQQILEATAQSTAGFTDIAAKLARGFASLNSSTDPGDVDPYDPVQQTLTPGPGPLSDLGSNFYGTERIGATEATGSVSFANTGTGAVNQSPAAFTLTFQNSVPQPDGTYPLYRNSAAFTALVGQTVTVPIIAEQPGTASNATLGQITVLVTTLPGVTVTNAAPVVGTDRQAADDYRTACREAASLTSPNGPADSYRYLATTGRDDGTYGNSTTGNSLGINRVYVSQDSTTGIVNVYYASASGPALSGSVTEANVILTTTPGVISVPDAITFTGLAAIATNVDVTYTVKMKVASVSGAAAGTYTKVNASASSPNAQADAVFTAIDNALLAYFASVDIGGFDQTAGAGTMYADEIRSQIAATWPTTYHTTLSAPGSDVSLALGHVAVLNNMNRTVILT